MKVALVVYRYSETHGGVERYVSDFRRALTRRGHEVHILTARGNPPEGAGDTFHVLGAAGGYAPLRWISFDRRAAKFLARNRFDLVHGFSRTTHQDIYRIGGGSHWEYLKQTHPSMATAWGRLRQRWDPRNAVALSLEAKTFAPGGAHLYTCISEKCRREIQEAYGVASERMVVIYNGVDPSRFHFGLRERVRSKVRSDFSIGSDEFLALFVGSGFERKGLKFALEALALVQKDRPVKCFVIGGGVQSRYRRLVRELKLGGRVFFLGHRTNVQDFYAAGDALLFPTLYEPFGTVVLEAMATGVPSITSREAGAAEVLTDGVDSAILHDPTNPDEIAARLRPWLDPARLAPLRDAALATAARFSIEANVDRTIEVYQRVLAEKGATARA
ncbi:MAG: glycosyltransferase family 4 protein [Planctomycetes bacterium]|nr:glycosyltransferase family 4 protein [Planctomycetota bacterium]